MNAQQQHCPFCKSELLQGATVCQCGAFQTARGDVNTPLGALMRMGLWANTMGLIIFITLFSAFNIANDASNLPPTQEVTGKRTVCMVDYSFDIQTSAGIKNLKQSQVMGSSPCESYSDKAMQLHKKYALKSISFSGSAPRGIYSNARIDRVYTAETPIYEERKPSILRILGKLSFAFLILVAGFFVYRLASKIWVRIMGRVTDPVWVFRN